MYKYKCININVLKIILNLVILISVISCNKVPTNPIQQDIPIITGLGDRDYRFIVDVEISNLDWKDKRKQDYFRTNWMNTFTNQIIYNNSSFSSESGFTDDKANYYDKSNPSIVRTRFKFATNINDNNKNYIGGVYYDETYDFGNRWRLIYISEKGEEQAFYGGDNNDNVPTSWVKYNFLFGYIKIN